MTNGNDAAFAREASTYPDEDHPDRLHYFEAEDGLTKREYFAGLAMQGFCAAQGGGEGVYSMVYRNYETGGPEYPRKNIAMYAEASVKIADALIAALNDEELK